MNCALHPDLPAAGYCPSCGRPLCQSCLAAAQTYGGCAACLRQPVAPTRSGLPLPAFIALGCLLLVLVVAGLGTGGYLYYRHLRERATEKPAVEQATPPSDQSAPTRPPVAEPPSPDQVNPPANQGSPPPQETTPIPSAPGAEAAKAAALDIIQEPNWVAKVAEHSDDWRTATVWVGPPQSEWAYVVKLQWDEGMSAYINQGVAAFEYGD